MVLAHICTMAHGSKPRSVDLELIRENAHAAAQFVSAEEFFRKVESRAARAYNFFLEGGAMNFIEESAITTKAYWLRVYRSCPNFAQ